MRDKTHELAAPGIIPRHILPVLDIVSASAGHTADGRLKHTARLRRAASGQQYWIYIELKVGSSRYQVSSAGPNQTGMVGKHIRAYPYVKKVGTAEVRVKGKVISFVFSPRALGFPERYGWRAEVNPAAGEGTSADRAPNRGFKLHDLRPIASITGKPKALTQVYSAAFTFGADQAGTTFECRLDDGPVASCTSPKAYDLVTLGEHRFSVRAAKDGHVGPRSQYHWEVVLPPPSVGGSSEPGTTTILVRHGQGHFGLLCPTGTSCSGKVTVAASAKTLASGTYSIPPGATRTVSLALTKAGKAATKKNARVIATATIANTPTASTKMIGVVLKRE